ncbi:MAG: response regulator [Leptospiraceae bacterium]|nr:response regulator [Leptospiraceae bacterium]
MQGKTSQKRMRLQKRGSGWMRWMAAPVFPGDSLKSRRAELMNTLFLISFAYIIIVLIGNLWGQNVPQSMILLNLALLAIFFAFRLILKSGYVDFISILLLCITFLYLIFASWSLGTIRTPTTAIFTLFVIGAGFLYGPRGILVSSVLSSLAVGALVLAENAGWLPVPDYSVSITQWITYTGLFAISGATVYWANGHMRKSLKGAELELRRRQKIEQQLVQAKEKAEQDDRYKSRLLSNVSHELRTPLNALVGYTELLMLNDDQEVRQKYLKIIHDSGIMLSTLINDILDLSIIQTGQLSIEKIPFSLNEASDKLQSYGDMLVQQCGKEIQFTIRQSGTVVQNITGDPVRIMQAMINLVSNAIKFTYAGAVECVFSMPAADKIEFRVNDLGIGVPEAQRERIFRPFEQLDQSTTRRYGGAGLGLAITKEIAELLGGTVGVEDRPDNRQGSSFYFIFPFEPVAEQDPGAIQHPYNALDFSNKKALLVDDNDVNLMLTTRLLERLGIFVIPAKNGIEAIAKFTNTPDLDLILMDIQMPGMDGNQATQRIREIESLENKKPIPIITLSADALKADKERSRLAGSNAHLSKPLDYQRLITAIHRFVIERDSVN